MHADPDHTEGTLGDRPVDHDIADLQVCVPGQRVEQGAQRLDLGGALYVVADIAFAGSREFGLTSDAELEDIYSLAGRSGDDCSACTGHAGPRNGVPRRPRRRPAGVYIVLTLRWFMPMIEHRLDRLVSIQP